MKPDNNPKGRWNRMKEYYNIGMKICFTIFLYLVSKDRLNAAFTMENFPVTQLSIVLLFETLVLIFLWTHVAEGEINMFQDNFEEFAPSIPGLTYGITVLLAIFLALLGAFSYNIVIYSSIYVCFWLFGTFSWWIKLSKLKITLKRARNEASPEDGRRKNWDVIESYEFENPHYLLGVTMLSLSFVSLIIGLRGELLSNSWTIWWLSAAYIMMILTIAIGEIVLMKWRHKRDDSLGEHYFLSFS